MEAIPEFVGVVKVGLDRLVSTGEFNETRVLVELSGGFIATYEEIVCC